MNTGDTIAAIATPPGTGGISIVKISGPEAVVAAAAIFQARNAQRRLEDQPSQRMVYGYIRGPEHDEVIDEVLVSILKGPHSYTGEDVVEINCHGGTVVTAAVLDLLLARGVRLAEPGEFTRRAFLNGRIDLTQVEGTIDLIEAKTRRAARMGSNMLRNGVGDTVLHLRERTHDIRSRIEAAIDFCEDEVPSESPGRIRDTLRRDLIPAVEKLLAGHGEGRLLRHGLRIALAGKPNVGKSSLMNMLLRRNRVIVTEHPGTTRDTIEEGFAIDGLPVLLSDTAGLRNAVDPVERIGQQMAKEAIDGADLVLMIIDASRPIDATDDDILNHIGDRPYVLVRNKIDLVPEAGERSGAGFPHGEGSVDISALYGDGIETLKEHLIRFAGVESRAASDGCLPNQRQKDLLSKSLSALEAAADPEGGSAALELMAVDLKDCERYFDRILGVDVESDVLDSIFSRFCIGK